MNFNGKRFCGFSRTGESVRDAALSHDRTGREDVSTLALIFLDREIIQSPVMRKFVLDQPFDFPSRQIPGVLYPDLRDRLVGTFFALQHGTSPFIMSVNAVRFHTQVGALEDAGFLRLAAAK